MPKEAFLINDFAGNPRRRSPNVRGGISRGGHSAKKLRAVMKRAAGLRRAGLSPSQAMRKAWTENPEGGNILMYSNPRRKSRKSRRSRRNPGQFAANPKRRRSRRVRRNSFAANPKRRRSYRRTRRNPALMGFSMPAVMPLLQDALWVAGGAVGTEMVGNLAMRQFPALGASTTMRLVTKGVAALGLGMVAAKFVGKRQGALLAVGGLSPIVADFLKSATSGIPLLAGASVAQIPAPVSGSALGIYAPLDNGLGFYAPTV